MFLFLSFEGSCHWLFGPSVFGFWTYNFLYSSLSRSGVGQVSQQTLGTLSSGRPRMPYTKATFLHSASSNCLPYACCHSHVAESLLQWKLSILESVQGEQNSLDQPVPSMTCSQWKVSPILPSSKQQVSHVSPPVLSRLLLCS